jgi:hypothetical protein
MSNQKTQITNYLFIEVFSNLFTFNSMEYVIYKLRVSDCCLMLKELFFLAISWQEQVTF